MVYSLILVILIPLAFFINTYLINSKYESDIDKITQRKAVFVEGLINSFIKEQLNENENLQVLVDQIAKENSEIVSLSIIKKQDEMGSFQVVASNKKDLIGQNQDDSIQNAIAWSKPEGVAFLDRNERGRFWNVTKKISDDSGEKKGLIAIAFSLEETDALINKTIRNSYWILVILILIVVLLISNQARLFGYAIAVTKLKEVDKMKDMFISMAGHELRTPLTAIKGYADLLGDIKEVSENKESKHFTENISLSAERLQNLVNDILEVSRLEGNRMPMEIKVVDPNPIISQCVGELKIQAQEKNLDLTCKLPDPSVFIKVDESRLKQILINLIGNSIKYTNRGSVNISTAIKNKELLIIIADTGIGISSENQANLFQKFYRIQNKDTKNIIGTGLGLWITLEIAKRMKGNITVESIEGVGSHFNVHFPIAKK
jgi:signal transduction histidine kinase